MSFVANKSQGFGLVTFKILGLVICTKYVLIFNVYRTSYKLYSTLEISPEDSYLYGLKNTKVLRE